MCARIDSGVPEERKVDACVYEINALQSRYSYYVRQMKQMDARESAG